jgi:hypothetical protein
VLLLYRSELSRRAKDNKAKREKKADEKTAMNIENAPLDFSAYNLGG